MKKTIATIGAAAALAGAVLVGTRAKPPTGCVVARDESCKRQMRAIGDRPAGAYFFGVGNAFPASEAVGNCEPAPPESCQ